MTFTEQSITVALCVLATMLTRFLPFVLFSRHTQTPEYIHYLGKALPGAVFGMLVVYCLKNISLTSGTYGLPEAVAIVLTLGLHIWRRQMLLSIAGGTICYMVVVQYIA